MSMLFFMLIFMSSPSASTEIRYTPLHADIEPEFESFIDGFIAKSDGLVTHLDFRAIKIQFSSLEYSSEGPPDPAKTTVTIGMCTWNWAQGNKIEIDKEFWDSASYFHKWYLFTHEAGHCICNRQHVDSKEENWLTTVLNQMGVRHERSNVLHDGCPISIMNPVDFSESCLREHQDYYMREMMKNCSPTLFRF